MNCKHAVRLFSLSDGLSLMRQKPPDQEKMKTINEKED